jgi:hypothetical protein
LMEILESQTKHYFIKLYCHVNMVHRLILLLHQPTLKMNHCQKYCLILFCSLHQDYSGIYYNMDNLVWLSHILFWFSLLMNILRWSLDLTHTWKFIFYYNPFTEHSINVPVKNVYCPVKHKREVCTFLSYYAFLSLIKTSQYPVLWL